MKILKEGFYIVEGKVAMMWVMPLRESPIRAHIMSLDSLNHRAKLALEWIPTQALCEKQTSKYLKINKNEGYTDGIKRKDIKMAWHCTFGLACSPSM